MINIINSWAQGIILAVIIATIIEVILPEGNNKKYVKTVIGIYILFVIIHPLISKISNVDVQSIIDNTTSQINEYEKDNVILETNSYIEETYKEKLESELNKNLKEKGYNVNSLNIDFETENEENYGQINSIIMQVSKINEDEKNNRETENTVNEVENIEINISNNNVNKNISAQQEDISTEEINSLKNYLSTTYMLNENEIHINE